MRAILSVIFAAGLLAGAGGAAAQSIQFRNVAARVVIVPQERSDVQVIFAKTEPRQPLKVTKRMDGATVVEGAEWFSWFWGPHANCDSTNGRRETFVPNIGQVSYDDLPQITVLMPMDAVVDAGGALYGSVGRAKSLHLRVAGCGDWTLANVRDALAVEFAGSGELHTGSAGSMTLNIAGASSSSTTTVLNGLTVDIAGVGDVRVAKASGPIGVHLAGGGNVHIAGGHASKMQVHIAGSGDVDFGGDAESLDANIAGSGFIRAAKVTGAVSKFVAGSGSVVVGQ